MVLAATAATAAKTSGRSRTGPLLDHRVLLEKNCVWTVHHKDDPSCFAACVALSSAGEPVVLGEALGFCGGDAGLSCCDADDDAGLRAELDGLRISDAACAAIVKAVLYAVRRRFFLSFYLFYYYFYFYLFTTSCVCWRRIK